MAERQGTCNICGQAPERPAKRMNYGQMVECCVCSCHDEHIGSCSSHAIFVRQARKGGVKGSGVGYGAGKCGLVSAMTAADHKVNAVRQARSDAMRLLRPMYVFMWGSKWSLSARPHRNLHDAGVGYVIAQPTGTVTEIQP